jgi:2-aminoadipate transaminase
MSRPPLVYDFLKGHPNNDELPVDDLFALFQSVDAGSLRSALQYGQERGNPDLITELRAFIGRQCATDVGNCSSQQARSIFITEGVSHGVDLLAAVATRSGDLVLTEDPTYFLIAGIFRSRQLIIGTMPKRISDDGIDFEALEEAFRDNIHPIPRLIYVIPAHQNPSGRCMSNVDRNKLAKIAEKYKILVVADEVYHLLDWGDRPRSARMVTWNSATDIHPETKFDDTHATTNQQSVLYGCVSVSSFTKIFSPGVRCGWIEADDSIIEALQNIGYIQSQGAVAPVMGSIMTVGLANRTVDHVLQRLREQYQIRCDSLCNILERETSLQLTCRPSGGYFVWIRFRKLESERSADEFLEYCLNHGIRFMPGSRCGIRSYNNFRATLAANEKTSLHSYARLCFAKMNADDVAKGAAVFVQCLTTYNATMK